MRTHFQVSLQKIADKPNNRKGKIDHIKLKRKKIIVVPHINVMECNGPLESECLNVQNPTNTHSFNNNNKKFN